jgi:hypothetical protein
MHITEKKDGQGKATYEVSFREHKLEEITERLNRFKRADEKPFEAVGEISDFNQRVYELFARPLVRALSNEYGAKLGREFHPLRFQRWAFSDLNPWLWWLGPAAQMVKAQRQPSAEDQPARKAEKAVSELTSASLDYYRALRDAASEAAFFLIYGNLFSIYLSDKHEAQKQVQAADAREQPFVKDALASIAQGGYAEALARVAFLLARKGEPLPLSRLQLKQDLMQDDQELLPAIEPEEARRIRGEQEIIVRYEPEKAMDTLPTLLAGDGDRDRLLTLLDRVVTDERVQNAKLASEQTEMLKRIRGVLGASSRRSSRMMAAK